MIREAGAVFVVGGFPGGGEVGAGLIPTRSPFVAGWSGIVTARRGQLTTVRRVRYRTGRTRGA